MELPDDIPGLKVIIGQLLQRNAELEARVKEPEARLDQDSTNPDKPPSSDGYAKRPAIERKRGGRVGGKKGHKGSALHKVAVPDKVFPIAPPDRCSCGQYRSDAPQSILCARQVHDLPAPKLEVTGYRVLAADCPRCGKTHRGHFPEGVSAPAQYGSGARALATMLNVNYKVPFNKISLLFADLFGAPINEGTVSTATATCHDRLAATEQWVGERVLESPVAHFDGTGTRCQGEPHWLHAATTDRYTYLFVRPNRGKKALRDPMPLIPGYKGWAVHDCWDSYFAFGDAKYAVCGAHILRGLNGLVDGHQRKWARHMRRPLPTVLGHVRDGTAYCAQKLDKIYDGICEMADLEKPLPIKTRTRCKKTKGRNLMGRLKKHKGAVLAFALFPNVPFTNNLAERDIRHIKTKQKVSGGFRTLDGAKTYARIEGFASTLRKNGRNVFKELIKVFDDQNYVLDLNLGK